MYIQCVSYELSVKEMIDLLPCQSQEANAIKGHKEDCCYYIPYLYIYIVYVQNVYCCIVAFSECTVIIAS